MKLPSLLVAFTLLVAGTGFAQSVKPLPAWPGSPPAPHPAPVKSGTTPTPRPFPDGQEVLLWSEQVSANGISPVSLHSRDTLDLRLQAQHDTYVILVARSDKGRIYPLSASRAAILVKAGSVVAQPLPVQELQPGLNDILAVTSVKPLTYAQASALATQGNVAASLKVERSDELTRPVIRDMRPPYWH